MICQKNFKLDVINLKYGCKFVTYKCITWWYFDIEITNWEVPILKFWIYMNVIWSCCWNKPINSVVIVNLMFFINHIFHPTKDGIQHVTGYVQPLENFISTLHQSNINTWNYLEDEVFLLQRPELRKDIGEHVILNLMIFPLYSVVNWYM